MNEAWGFTVDHDVDNWEVYLPHQCDHWRITGDQWGEQPRTQAEALRELDSFIAEAQAARAALAEGRAYGVTS